MGVSKYLCIQKREPKRPHQDEATGWADRMSCQMGKYKLQLPQRTIAQIQNKKTQIHRSEWGKHPDIKSTVKSQEEAAPCEPTQH